MKKIIKRWGNSLIIRLSPDELKMYELEEGDVVEIPDEALYRAGEGEK